MPLVLGGAILYWMYRGEDWQQIRHVMTDEMDWTWMLLSFPFGILAQMFRGWRWRQTLEPVGERPRTSVSIHSVFLSYAASLVIPRVGEFTRCGVLKRYDGVSFPKALGTVVTERAIDSLLVMGITAIVLLLEMSTFGMFFRKTGTNLESILHRFSWAGYFVATVSVNDLQGYLGGSHLPEGCAQHSFVCMFHTGHLAQLFPALLSHLFLFRLHGRLRTGVCIGNLYCWVHCRHRANAQRCRSLAFRRQNHADTLWRSRRACPLFRAHRPYRPDHAGHSAWHLCLAGTEFYKDKY